MDRARRSRRPHCRQTGAARRGPRAGRGRWCERRQWKSRCAARLCLRTCVWQFRLHCLNVPVQGNGHSTAPSVVPPKPGCIAVLTPGDVRAPVLAGERGGQAVPEAQPRRHLRHHVLVQRRPAALSLHGVIRDREQGLRRAAGACGDRASIQTRRQPPLDHAPSPRHTTRSSHHSSSMPSGNLSPCSCAPGPCRWPAPRAASEPGRHIACCSRCVLDPDPRTTAGRCQSHNHSQGRAAGRASLDKAEARPRKFV